MSDRSGHMQLVELLGAAYLENTHSDIIAFLLQPDADHSHPEYGASFLELVREQGLGISGTSISRVSREHLTDSGRRIDLLIETEHDAIVVENKVFATDLDDQISDYDAYVTSAYSHKNVAIIYLTVDGRDIPPHSLSSRRLTELVESNSLMLASYEDTVLPWLKQLNTKAQDEEVLRSALIQYADALEGLCGMREENLMIKQTLVTHYLEKYESASLPDFGEVYEASRLLDRAMEMVQLAKALDYLQERIAERGHRVFFTQGQKRYMHLSDCVKAASESERYVGIEVPLETSDEAKHGLAIEFSSTSHRAKLSYGVMGRGQKNDRASVCQTTLQKEWPDHSFSSSTWWWAHTSGSRETVGAFFLVTPSQDSSIETGLRILDQIAEEWFADGLIRILREAT